MNDPLPGLHPVAPGYWVTLHNPRLEGFVQVDDNGRPIGICSVDGQPLTQRDYRRLASVGTQNMIRAEQGLRTPRLGC